MLTIESTTRLPNNKTKTLRNHHITMLHLVTTMHTADQHSIQTVDQELRKVWASLLTHHTLFFKSKLKILPKIKTSLMKIVAMWCVRAYASSLLLHTAGGGAKVTTLGCVLSPVIAKPQHQ